MQNFPTKVDNVSSEPAAEYNNLTSELLSVLTTLGMTPDSGSIVQLAQAIAAYVATGNMYAESGSSNTFTCTPTIATRKVPDAYYNGMIVEFNATHANSGAATITVGSLGSKNIKKADGSTALDSGDIKTSGLTKLWYDGTVFRLQSSGTPADVQSGVLGSSKNLCGDWASNATVTYTADELILKDASGNYKKFFSLSDTANKGTAGPAASGRDQAGAFSNSTWCYVWAIGKADGTVKLILSASASALAALPSGYTYYARISEERIDGSGNFLVKSTRGDHCAYDTWQSALAAGTAASFTDVDLSSLVPAASSDLANLHIATLQVGGGAGHARGWVRKNGSAYDPSGTDSLSWTYCSSNNSGGVGVAGVGLQPTDQSAIIEYMIPSGACTMTIMVIGYIRTKG